MPSCLFHFHEKKSSKDLMCSFPTFYSPTPNLKVYMKRTTQQIHSNHSDGIKYVYKHGPMLHSMYMIGNYQAMGSFSCRFFIWFLEISWISENFYGKYILSVLFVSAFCSGLSALKRGDLSFLNFIFYV